MIRLLVAHLCAILLSGCGTMFKDAGFGRSDPARLPQTYGEVESGYTYIPIDPFPVQTEAGASCRSEGKKTVGLLEALPDNAVRMLVEKFDLSGNVSYLTAKAGAAGESYRVTVDYINADTINVPVAITKLMRVKGTQNDYKPVNIFSSNPEGFDPGSEVYDVTRIDSSRLSTKGGSAAGAVFNIPVYVGVGLRVSANVHVVGATANISGIGVIGAEAEADRLRGSLIVQTLGVNGKSVASALPIQNELNRTTAQNAIVSVGSIKALLYADETIKSPRVVGLYLPFPGGKPLVNALISELSKERVTWYKPCPS
jgi:hypothetical protein